MRGRVYRWIVCDRDSLSPGRQSDTYIETEGQIVPNKGDEENC